ncbi:hypothetical protein [Accumulibacter sp.]|uniref:hypothetical protein n=1 Tax=Accumulibacter sp. TaxID=2053492 RepID=UPI001A52FA40|nr:hypothetical protein [Accumulibacter sp.]MBL8375532.1 hypothetical protein [Accumulibacter sp.]
MTLPNWQRLLFATAIRADTVRLRVAGSTEALVAMRGMTEKLKLTVNDGKTHLCQIPQALLLEPQLRLPGRDGEAEGIAPNIHLEPVDHAPIAALAQSMGPDDRMAPLAALVDRHDPPVTTQSSQISISAYFAPSLVSAVLLRQNGAVTHCL